MNKLLQDLPTFATSFTSLKNATGEKERKMQK
jgi:hypothetical protein